MKNLEMENYGVVSLSFEEMEGIDGGIIPLLLLGAAAILLSGCSHEIYKNLGTQKHQTVERADGWHGAGGSY